jgi:hypothetical protein
MKFASSIKFSEPIANFGVRLSRLGAPVDKTGSHEGLRWKLHVEDSDSYTKPTEGSWFLFVEGKELGCGSGKPPTEQKIKEMIAKAAN